MVESDNLRYTKLALNNGSGAIPALGFGTLIPDPVATRTATRAALEAGFRQLDAAERYRNENEVGEAMQEVFRAGTIKREEVFIATKLWNNNHRPERVKPAFEASLKKLQLDYVDLYLIHTPFAFQPGDEQDPRDANGNVIYDKGVTLLDTWRALEGLVDEGRCKAIGLSDVSLEQTREIFEVARIKPAVVHVESHPYLPQWDLLDYCRKNGIVLQAFAALGHSSEPKLLEDAVITAIARRVNKTPAQVLLAWAIQRGTALLTTSKTPSRIKENFGVSTLPEAAVREISEGIKLQVRFNAVVETGVPGFIPREREVEILMQDDVVALFAYDRWANTRVLDACRKLTAGQYVAEPVPGWSSVRSTIYHIALVTEIHLRTLAGDLDESNPTEAELATVDDAARLLERAYRRFEELRPTLTPERLNALLRLRPPGFTATLPRWAMLRHIVNHSTYHRGQVASKLKRFGIEQPVTDFFFWVIEQIPQET